MPQLRILTIALVLVVSLGRLSGQTKDPDKKGYQDAKVLRQKSVLLKTGDDVMLSAYDQSPQFPNINQTPYFYDKKILAEIKKLQKKGDLEELNDILIPYVDQFGVGNFLQDLSLIWLAGMVKHTMGDTSQAVYYYELVKMHNRGLNIPEKTYDSLVAKTETEWLPIDDYYELLELRKKIDNLVSSKKVLENMGTKINSDDPDYAPSMHPSDSILIFTSRRDTSGMKSSEFIDPFHTLNEDLYYAEIDFISGGWKQARRLSDTINSQYNEGSACLAADGKTLFFTRCRTGRGFGDCDIYTASYDPINDTWINVQNLGKNINSKAWDSQPNLALDGQTLFFSSNRKGGFGGTDIYYSTLMSSGKWSEARNAGPLLNTPQNEVTPFFHKINQTLYFSSTGHLKNFGGYDIFKSRWVGDRWEAADNVGPLVNTVGNEYYFSIDSKGETIFYANSKDPNKDHVKQNFDLYSFPMPMEARPDAIAALRGFLVDSVSGYTLQGTVMIIDLETNIEVAPKKINEYGYFEFNLIDNKKYRIYVLGDNFLTVKKDFEMKGDTTFQVLTKSFEEDKPIVFESLSFGSNSTKLKTTVKPHLDYIVRFLENYPMFKLEVEGHTDSDGRDESNLRLSKKRAESIAMYIIEKGGFDPNRVTSEGFGETRPIVPNDTDENKEKNRRVEFKLILDKTYDGNMLLPTEDELFVDEELDLIDDIDTNEEFEWSEEEKKSWESELEVDPELDLEAELEDDILDLIKENEKGKDGKKGKGGGGIK